MTPAELKKMTKPQLLKLARAMKIDASSSMLKADLINLIKKGGPKRAKKKAAVKKAARKKAAPKKKAAAKKAAKKKAVKKAAKAKPPATKEPSVPAARGRRIAADTIRQQAVASKYYLGAEEKAMPPVEAMDIPAGYNIDRIVAMVRDPRWVFSYWEVTRDRLYELETRFGDDWPKCRMVLRVYDLNGKKRRHYDIAVNPDARNWYINVAPETRYQLAIGLISPGGKFISIAVSNIIETPRAGVSDVIDDRWMVPEELFDKIFAASGGHDMQASSAELRELLEKRLLEEISSGAVSSPGSEAVIKRKAERGFRLWVATELILYGGTEPDARVTVQGKEIKLRPDGTFSLRFALPDGTIDIPVAALSGDKVEERSVDTSVRKKSQAKEPVIR